jgi:hypothetical protein
MDFRKAAGVVLELQDVGLPHLGGGPLRRYGLRFGVRQLMVRLLANASLSQSVSSSVMAESSCPAP